MKSFANYVKTHQVTVLSLSLVLMVSSSFFVLVDAFNHLA